jgi:hypothetical protein
MLRPSKNNAAYFRGNARFFLILSMSFKTNGRKIKNPPWADFIAQFLYPLGKFNVFAKMDNEPPVGSKQSLWVVGTSVLPRGGLACSVLRAPFLFLRNSN